MPLVQRQHVAGAVPLGEYDDRSVGETDREVRVPAHDVAGGGDVVGGEGLQPVDTTRDLVDKRELGAVVDLCREQIVQLGQDEGGEEQRRGRLRENLRTGGVVPLA